MPLVSAFGYTSHTSYQLIATCCTAHVRAPRGSPVCGYERLSNRYITCTNPEGNHSDALTHASSASCPALLPGPKPALPLSACPSGAPVSPSFLLCPAANCLVLRPPAALGGRGSSVELHFRLLPAAAAAALLTALVQDIMQPPSPCTAAVLSVQTCPVRTKAHCVHNVPCSVADQSCGYESNFSLKFFAVPRQQYRLHHFRWTLGLPAPLRQFSGSQHALKTSVPVGDKCHILWQVHLQLVEWPASMTKTIDITCWREGWCFQTFAKTTCLSVAGNRVVCTAQEHMLLHFQL